MPVPEQATAPRVHDPGRIVAPAGVSRSTLVGMAVTVTTNAMRRTKAERISI